MKKALTILALFLVITLQAQNTTALLLVDIQEFYFPGGFSALHEPEQAATNAASILAKFREQGAPIIHIQHKTDTQMAIHASVTPVEGEKSFVKTEINSYNGTGLKAYFDSLGIENVVIVGMQTHMCVEAATRASYDFGYSVTLIKDACATQAVECDGIVTPPEMVHNSTLGTLKNYAEVISTEEYLSK